MTAQPVAWPIDAARGLPETVMSPEAMRRLPLSAAPAPWVTRCHVTAWWHRPRRDSADLLPAPLRSNSVVAIAWTLVRYSQTPVGRYDELAAVFVCRGRQAVHIPFLAVDSAVSVVGGRANWLLPKALATFNWSADGVTVTSAEPSDPSWRLQVASPRLRWPIPVYSRFGVDQVATTDDGIHRFRARMRGLARYARIAVEGSADGPLAGLLRMGDHRGFVIANARFAAGPLQT
jgi:hypothetical protein